MHMLFAHSDWLTWSFPGKDVKMAPCVAFVTESNVLAH